MPSLVGLAMKCSIKISNRKVDKNEENWLIQNQKAWKERLKNEAEGRMEKKTMTQDIENNTGKGKIKLNR